MRKYCARCKQLYPPEAFGHHTRTWDKRQSWCRACCRVYARQRYARVRGYEARPRPQEEG